MQFLEEVQESKAAGAGGGGRAKRAKLKQVREVNGIGGEADDQLKKIFTPEPWQKYEADKAKRKEQIKQKMRG